MDLDKSSASITIVLLEVEPTCLTTQAAKFCERFLLALLHQLSASLSGAVKPGQQAPLLGLNSFLFGPAAPRQTTHLAIALRHLAYSPTVSSEVSRAPPSSIPPKVLEPIGRHVGVPDGVLDVLVPKVMLKGPRVVAIFRELEPTGTPSCADAGPRQQQPKVRTIRQRPGNAGSYRSAWWRTQSESNPSQQTKFPGNREINREFRRFRSRSADLAPSRRAEFNDLQQNSLPNRN